jgi:hypothetical protein
MCLLFLYFVTQETIYAWMKDFDDCLQHRTTFLAGTITLFIWSQRLLNYLAFKSFSVPGDGYSKNVLIIFPQCFVNGNPRFLADIYVLLHPSINSFLWI